MPIPQEVYEHLKCLVIYNPYTGIFTWKERSGTTDSARWNKRFAGKPCGYKTKIGRITICVLFNGKRLYVLAHRLAWFIYYGKLPELEIDHINGDSSDNRISNLRDVSHKINSRNMKMMPTNTSGYCNVYWDKQYKKWSAKVRTNDKNHYLGWFDDKKEAVKASAKFKKQHGFTKRHGT